MEKWNKFVGGGKRQNKCPKEMAVSKRLFAINKTMYILLHMARTVKTYLRYYQHVPPQLNLTCPQCGGKLHKHSHYERSVVTKTEVFRIPIYRWRCPLGHVTVSVLPDFLSPYCVFVGWIQERVWIQHFLYGKSYRFLKRHVVMEQVGGISRTTLRRWCLRWRRNLEPFLRRLAQLILEHHPFEQPHRVLRQFEPEEAGVYLTWMLWSMIHPNLPYPFYGFFPWLQQVFQE